MCQARQLIASLFTAIFIVATQPVQSIGASSLLHTPPLSSVTATSPGKLVPVIGYAQRADTSPALRDILSVQSSARTESTKLTLRLLPKSMAVKPSTEFVGGDSTLQRDAGAPLMPSPTMNFEGIRNLDGVYPPDTEGDIGFDPATNKKYYVQWVNLSFAIWNVTGASPVLVYGPVNGNSIWSGFGGVCETSDDGDPIVLYDSIAHRWLMSQFSVSGPYHQCIAISQTGDPTGAWFRYDFLISNTKMNDYPKFGVWPDAYYMTANQFVNGSSWGGAGVFAFNRAKLLAGDPTANFVYFDLYDVNSGFGGMLPSNMEGPTLPPVGASNYFAEVDAASELDANAAMRLWQFHVDWTTPANSTFGQSGQPDSVVPVTPFTRLSSGIPQPQPPPPQSEAPPLDTLGDRLMYRLVYRNFGDHESLVVNHSADDGAGRAGVRWYEVRSPALSPYIYQQGTYAPADGLNRWMGSIAMDHHGNMALGFSVANSTVYPSIRYTGRLADDPTGSMTQGETQIIAGSGSQTGTAHRWGDYSTMSIDPSDDCTFWYTQEYIQATGAASWQTRIASFKFPGCSTGAQGTLAGAISALGTGTPVAGAQVSAMAFVTQSIATVSGANGFYALQAPVGTYKVSAVAYGYQPASVSGISVVSGTTTTANLQLTISARRIVSGFVTDAVTHWPLYAHVNIQGTPISPPPPYNDQWTDPVTGYYSVTLSDGVTYTIVFNAFAGGYQPATLSAGPLTSNRTLNVGLNADGTLCTAPGYRRLGITETFDSATPPLLPSGWATVTVSSNGTPAAWATNAGTHNPAGNDPHSLPNLVYFNSYDAPAGATTRLYRTTPVNMKTLPSSQVSFWMFHDLGYASYPDRVQVQVSTNGSTWANIGAPITRTTTPVGWQQHTVSLGAYASATSLYVGFLGISAFGNDVHLDDIEIGAACLPQVGGLVVGNIYDANTNAPLAGALVSNDRGNTTTAVALVNPTTPGAFYALFSPSGTHTFSASLPLYGTATAHPTVVVSNTIRQDMYLPAAKLAQSPAGLQATLGLGSNTALPLQISNTGGVPAQFKFYAVQSSSNVMGLLQHAEAVVEPPDQNERSTADLQLAPTPKAQPLAAGDVIRTWSPNLASIWGVTMDGADNTIWVSSPSASWGGIDRMVEYDVFGAPTGRSFPLAMPHQYGPADMTYNSNTGMLWIMGVGTGKGNCVFEFDPVSGYTGNSVCPDGGFAASQRGLAYDPIGDTYFAGSWNDGMIHHFDANGVMLDEVNVGLAIAGLAYNPDTHHLFATLNVSPTVVFVLDASNNYAALGNFSITGFGSNAGAGLEMGCDGNLWAVNQAANDVALVNIGETTTFCQVNRVPWLTATPVSGTVPATGAKSINIGFSATQPAITQPGVYTAQLKLWQKTPYPVSAVPVTMTVTAISTWGQVTGVVNGLGRCDVGGAPLANASVVIQDQHGVTRTLTTDANGVYKLWLDQSGSPLNISVSYSGWQSIQSNGVSVSAQQTTTVNFSLRQHTPCVTVTPSSIWATLISGSATTQPLTFTNTGLGAASYNISAMNPLATNVATTAQAVGHVQIVLESPVAKTSATAHNPMTPINSGGPDAFGYTFLDSNVPDGPAYHWIEIATPAGGAGATITSLTGIDDGYYYPLLLPFTFKFYGTGYNNLAVATNGAVYFENIYLGLINTPIPGANTYGINSFIAHYWNDLTVNPGNIYYLAQGDQFIIEYYQVSHYGTSPAAATWEVILFRNSNILLQYQNPGFGNLSYDNGAVATVGIQMSSTVGLQYSYNSPALAPSLAICYAYPGQKANCTSSNAGAPWLNESSNSGSVTGDGTSTVEVTVTALPTMTVGVYNALLSISTGDPGNPTVSVPVQMSIAPPGGLKNAFIPIVLR
jgi:Carboxypeptidase regulatory-like domain